jgi:aminoglycoside phosphotransferase (APT) family kinase protein
MTAPTLPTMDSGETQAVLRRALQERHGADARLEAWTADFRFTEHGKQRVVRYDLQARLAGASHVQHDQWVGKFYDRDQDARRVAAVLQALAGGAGGGVRVPRVVAYHEARRQLLLTYEPGEPVSAAIAHDTDAVLRATGRALAALHAAPITTDMLTTPAGVLANLRARIEDLCGWLPGEAAVVRRAWNDLEHRAPSVPAAPTFVHGDFGPANLLWSLGQIVVLDFDKCAQGDPALDLGNLMAQLHRMTVRKPDRLRDFAAARARVLDAYRRSSPPDPDLDHRVDWYERATLLRKIHGMVGKTPPPPPGPPEPNGPPQPQAEAARLLRLV